MRAHAQQAVRRPAAGRAVHWDEPVEALAPVWRPAAGPGFGLDFGAGVGGAARHPLADDAVSRALRSRAEQITADFDAIEPALRALVPQQFADGFAGRAVAQLRGVLRLDLPESAFAAGWTSPLDVRTLHARCVIGTFCRLMDPAAHTDFAALADGEDAPSLIRRWGFHAMDITPCADGRLSGVVDYILRVPRAVVAYRTSHAGAMFDVAGAVRHWETVELRRWRMGVPNDPAEQTRYLKIGVYHFSSADPRHEGCAAHGSDGERAAAALLERLEQFVQAVHQTHGPEAGVAALLIGVDTDTDAVRVHVPDAGGRICTRRYVDNGEQYASTRDLPREAAKEAIRAAVAACAGVAAEDGATEGMRWLCGYILKNNIAQIDAVRDWHGGIYPDAGHTEKLIIVGDAIDDVQLRNLAFQAQMATVEEGAADLDVAVRILRGLQAPRGLAVPVLVHFAYDARIPGSEAAARCRARRLCAAIHARYADLAARGLLHVQPVVRASDGSALSLVAPPVATTETIEVH